MSAIEFGPGVGAILSFDPSPTSLLQQEATLEVVLEREIDAATVDASTVTLVDLTTGYAYTPTLEVHTAGGVSRIEVRPDRLHEFDHRLQLTVGSGVLFTDGTPAGPFTEYFMTVKGGRPVALIDKLHLDLMDTRVTALTNPWKRGWDDSDTVGQRVVGMKNASRFSADWLAGETPGAYVGAPADAAAARVAYSQFTEEMSGCIAAAYGWYFTGTAAYRDDPGGFIMSWLRNFDITPKYTGDRNNHPWDAILWSLCIIKLCYAVDLLWEQDATDLKEASKGEIRLKLAEWAGILANDWKPDLDAQPIGNITQWVNTAVAAVAELIGDHKMRAWAFDGTDQPNLWTANARPLTVVEDDMFAADGSYINEADREARGGAGRGWTYGVYATNACMWHYTILANAGRAWRWAFTNVYGDTLEDHLNFYCDFIDGTAVWSNRYPGNTISGYDMWYNAQKFFGKGAYFYRSAKLRATFGQSYGTDPSGNNLAGPFGEDQIHWTGGNLEYTPASIVADATPPPDVTGLAAADKGATWVKLTWTHSAITTDRDIPQHYEIIDETGAPVTVGYTRQPGFTVTNLDPSTAYTFRVKAKDIAGNVSTGVTVAPTTDAP